MKTDLKKLYNNLPPVIARKEVGKYFGGVVSPKLLANLDCLGEGPIGRFKVGRNVAYKSEALLNWLQERVE